MHNRNKFQFWVWPSRFHGIHFICCEHMNNSMNEFSSRILIFNLSNIQTQICKYHDLLSDVRIYFLLEYWSSIYQILLNRLFANRLFVHKRIILHYVSIIQTRIATMVVATTWETNLLQFKFSFRRFLKWIFMRKLPLQKE